MGAGVVLVAMAVGGVVVGTVAGRAARRVSATAAPTVAASNRVTIPFKAPQILAGQQVNPEALNRNAELQNLASNLAARSTVSFASVYGPFPPSFLPSTDSFFVDAAHFQVGANLFQSTEFLAFSKQLAGQFPGSTFVDMTPQPGIFGGEIVCAGFSTETNGVGECLWYSGLTSVLVTTFSPDIESVMRLTNQVVTDLHGAP